MVSVQRRLNSTGRLRITRDRVSFYLENPADGLSFPWATATLNLEELDVPSNAAVAIEAYYRSSFMRFDCGSLSDLRIPKQMISTDIDRGGAIRFRVLVTSPLDGRILAVAEGIRPATKDDGLDRQPLLPVRETDLGEELWKVDIDFRNGPTLLLNNRVRGLAARLRSNPLLQGLIIPHAFRSILENLPAIDENSDDDWSGDWRKLLDELQSTPDAEIAEDNEARREWIDMTVSKFCSIKEFVRKIDFSSETTDTIHGQ